MGIKHLFTSSKADGADATLVQPGDWNDDHVITSFALPGDISPAQLVANTDDWAPTGLADAAVIRASTDASRNLTGITGGADGRVLVLMNVGAFDLVLVHDATSTLANRFYCPNNANYTMRQNSAVELVYDSTSSRWRVGEADGGIVTHEAAADPHSAYATDTDLTNHAAAADPHAGYVLESLIDAAGDLYKGSAADTVARLARGSDDQVLRSTATDVAWESQEFTVGGVVKSPVDADLIVVWRAPFACTVTAVRGYADVGTTSVVNAFKGSLATPTNFCSTNLTIGTADSWQAGTVTTSAVAAGDAVGIRVVTAGTAGEITIQIDFTRP